MTVQAHLKWTDGLQFVARAGESPAVVLDSSDGASGASPMQLVLMGSPDVRPSISLSF